MTTYAIGDVQGCFYQLQKLLEKIKFDNSTDTLWFTGDLINRGPDSLEVLRFVKELGNAKKFVLGNHDLHLLGVFYGARALSPKDTLQKILSAPDLHELMNWLRYQPLIHYDEQTNYLLVHAGIAPEWNVNDACSLADEVEAVLQSELINDFIKQMYGDEPAKWDEGLIGIKRWRCIINYLTRMRFCHADGSLELSYKGPILNKPAGLIPWFDYPERKNTQIKIIFGHWAALGGYADTPNIFPLDTGCVWGNCLTAMRLEDGEKFKVQC